MADEHGLELKGSVDAIIVPRVKAAAAAAPARVNAVDDDAKLEARLAQLKK